MGLENPASEGARRGAILLEIARACLEEELGRSHPRNPAEDGRNEPWLREPGATFVTLRRGAELRGCIGSVEIVRPLIDDIRHNAVAAALRDPRFPPLRADELGQIMLEVTLLSAPEPIDFTGEADLLAQLRPGEDGLLLQWKHHRSTYLPQVWEVLREPSDFLASLKKKAGLATDFWHHDLDVRRYTAEHWSEKAP